ncbi:hypothetical protein D3C79_708650 [compost metagenome]
MAQLPRLGWQVLPGLTQGPIGLTRLEHHGDHRQLTLGVGMHQVPLKRIGSALDEVFAGGVEVELLELKAHAIELQAAAGGIVDLHRVAVVDQGLATRQVVELQRRQLGLHQTREVDRRLVAAGALAIFRGQAGPFRRAGLAAVFPVHCGSEGGGAEQQGAGQQGLFHHISLS